MKRMLQTWAVIVHVVVPLYDSATGNAVICIPYLIFALVRVIDCNDRFQCYSVSSTLSKGRTYR